MAEILSGSFSVINEELSILSAPARSHQRLAQFRAILEGAQSNGKSFNELQEDVRRDAPEFSGLIERLAKRKQSIGWLITTALAIAGIAMDLTATEPLTEDQMANAVRRGMQPSYVSAPYQIQMRFPLTMTSPQSKPSEIADSASDARTGPDIGGDDSQAKNRVAKDQINHSENNADSKGE